MKVEIYSSSLTKESIDAVNPRLLNKIKSLELELTNVTAFCKLKANKLFDDDFAINFTYVSNKIERNSITRQEVQEYYRHQNKPYHRSIIEIQEMKNHFSAWEFVRSQTDNPIENFSLSTILNIHYMVTYQILQNHQAGLMRNTEVRVSNSPLITPKHEELESIMRHYFAWFHKARTTMHPVVLAAAAHIKLGAIHPFVDGNGRTARLFTNLILLHYNLPPIILDEEEIKKYFLVLRAHSLYKHYSAFIDFTLSNSIQSWSYYLYLAQEHCN